MKNQPYIIGAALAALAGLWVWSYSRARSSPAGLAPMSNGASMPRLPALPPLPPLPNIQGFSGAAPNAPRMPAMPGIPTMPRMPALWR